MLHRIGNVALVICYLFALLILSYILNGTAHNYGSIIASAIVIIMCGHAIKYLLGGTND